jgi:formate dehydrogenase major subunit
MKPISTTDDARLGCARLWPGEAEVKTSIRFSIDGRQIVAEKGATILEAALENDIYIPHLCYYPGLNPSGVCRLCTVEVNRVGLVLACRTPVEEGMEVEIHGPDVIRAVGPVVELLIADHHSDCRGCRSNGRCELQKMMAHLNVDRRRVRRLRPPREVRPLEKLNSLLDYDPNKCICCGICVQTCRELSGDSGLYFVDRGYGTKIAFYGDEAECRCCLECAARCPVGVLIPKRE